LGTNTIEGAVSVPKGVSPTPLLATVSAHQTLIYSSVASAKPSSTPPVAVNDTMVVSPAKAYSQYVIYHGSKNFRAYKQQKGINGNIYIVKDSCQHKDIPAPAGAPEYTDSDGPFHHVFSTFLDLTILYTEALNQTFLAMNNKRIH
jgi:hypothetical protein